MKIKIFFLMILISFGIADAAYLTYEHYQKIIPPCTVNVFLPILSDCGKVLTSSYSVMFGIPLAVLGVIQYSLLLTAAITLIISRKKIFSYWIIFQSMTGAVFSLYFVYLQLVIIKSFCLYCMLSALVSFMIFFFVDKIFYRERFFLRLSLMAFVYQKIIKPIFFLFDPEFIHEMMTSAGELVGKTFLKNYFNWKLNYHSSFLKQKVAGINFEGPIGLAAGFDYKAQLTQTLSSLGFGFQSAGTITKISYQGNPKPRLGRLPKSQSLMVNKGFKNPGAEKVVEKLSSLNFKIPLGISVGLSNNKDVKNLSEAVDDIKKSFNFFEKAKIKNSYYELNISCPNLVNVDVNFYQPKILIVLLNKIKGLHLKKPVFVKMPISKSNPEFLTVLETISQFSFIKGVIIGNLLSDRKNPLLNQQEVRKFKVGYFSGKPCEPISNELIKLTYKKYKNKLVIIGCGGVFSGQDAYKKIKLGASLIQLITGMIFQGPQLISQIDLELEDLLKKDGFKNIKQAIGYENN
jgi:dihydroorotate dehydrogenase subfamily 2